MRIKNSDDTLASADAVGRLAGGIEGPEPSSKSARTVDRFRFIDSLRGLAALGVLFLHLSGHLWQTPLFAQAPKIVRAVFWRGFVGVYIFFVISGFVITYSIRRQRINARFLGSFALRRSIRLDPSYWAAIAVCAILAWRLHASYPSSFPQVTAKLILAHMAYLPGIIGYPFFTGVFWTLCIEVQLYLAVVVFFAVMQRLMSANPSEGIHGLGDGEWIADVLLLLSGVASAFAASRADAWTSAWLGPLWFAFAAGALLARSMQQRSARIALYAILLAILICVPLCRYPMIRDCMAATLFVSLAVHVAALRQGLTSWLNNAVLQWLGRISYSLYLWHPLALLPIALRERRLGGVTLGTAMILFVAGTIGSLVMAQATYFLFERPSLRLATKIRLRGIHGPSRH